MSDKSAPPALPFRALQALGGSREPAERFCLRGNRTRISRDSIEDNLEGQTCLDFSPTDPGKEIPERHGKFSEAERDNILCLLASPDGRFGSLRIGAGVQIYTCCLGLGHQITYRIRPGRHLWFHLIAGSLRLNHEGIVENQHAKISDEKEVSISSLSDSEFLLLDLS